MKNSVANSGGNKTVGWEGERGDGGRRCCHGDEVDTTDARDHYLQHLSLKHTTLTT